MKISNKNLILVIILILSQFNFYTYTSNEDNAATVVAAAAVGTAAGYGFFKLFSSFACSSDQLVEDACNELMKAKDLSRQLEIIQSEFNGLSKFDKQELMSEVDEELAEQIASTAPRKVVDQSYLTDLRYTIKNLKYYQDKFPKRIRKLEKFRNKEKYAPVIVDMKELGRRISLILPNLETLNDYVNNNLRYFELDQIMHYVSNFYSTELKMLESKKIIAKDLKRKIYAKFHTSYPLIEYVNQIEKDIYKLEKSISKACLKYEELTEDAQSLKRKISRIKDFIATDKDYFAEQRALEEEKAQKDSVLAGGMFLLGAAAGALTGSSTVENEPKKELVIVEKDSTYYETPDEYIIYE